MLNSMEKKVVVSTSGSIEVHIVNHSYFLLILLNPLCGGRVVCSAMDMHLYKEVFPGGVSL